MERRAKTEEFKNTSDIIEVKKGWYNFVLKEPLKRNRRQANTIHNQSQ